MTNAERLDFAYSLLLEVVANWDEDDVEIYTPKMSFDELVREIGSIKLRGLK